MNATLTKLKRLRSMPPTEVGGRLRERMRSEWERARYHLRVIEVGQERFLRWFDPAIASFKSYLAEKAAPRFYFPAVGVEREKLRRFVESRYPEWIEAAVAEADKLCEHRFTLLGLPEVRIPGEIDWHRDPVTSNRWPVRFWADYDPVHDHQSGDPKVIHELNRHQHLPRLGKAYFYTENEKYAREAVDQMLGWIAQNPPATGVNWQSSLEIGLRATSWIWTLFFLLPSRSLDETVARRIGKSLFAQIDHVFRYPSTFTSPNTHLIGEAAAVFLGGVVFGEWKHAAAWREWGKSVLVGEIEKQITEDGVYGELATYYHCYALDFFLQAMLLAQRTGSDFPERAWQRLGRMIDFLLHMTRPDGSIPLLGDDDGGRALALGSTSYRSFQDALSTAAALFLRGEYKQQAGSFHEETLFRVGHGGWERFQTLPAVTPTPLSAAFDRAGCFVQRSGWSPSDSHVVFDCGGMGLFNGGHGHADALSFVFFTGGEELLIDPGTYCYNAAPEWRDYFRSTAAHNTVVVDGATQSEPAGTFKWKTRADASVLRRFALPGIECIEAEHYGYQGLPGGVIHRRRLLHLKPDLWVVLDQLLGVGYPADAGRLVGAGGHRFDFHYHFAPQAEISLERDDSQVHAIGLTCRGRSAALRGFLCASAPLAAEVIGGWASRAYGEKQPTAVLRGSVQADAPVSAITLLSPELRPARAFLPANHPSAACEVISGATRDYFVLPAGGGVIAFGDYSMDGEFFWLRTDAGRLVSVLAIGGRRFEAAGIVLFNETQPAPYLFAQYWSGLVTITRGGAGRGALRSRSEHKVYVRHLRNRELQRQ